MPVCPYFLQGNCRYGDKCWNTHPNQGRQNGFGNSWGQSSNQRSVTFKDSFGNQNKFAALAPQSKQASSSQVSTNIKDFTPTQIIDMVSQEMTVWEQSKMWPFSCYAYAKETDCLPGFEDTSPEELRIEAYTAEKAGTFVNYKQKAAELAQAYKEKRQQLHKPSPQLKQKLLEIITNNKNKSTGGSSGGLFGAVGGTATGGGFTNNSMGASSVFGGAGTSGSTQATGLFGQKSQGSGMFPTPGQNTGNVFGNASQAQPSGGLFGAASQPDSVSGGFFQQKTGAAAVGVMQQNPSQGAGALFSQNANPPQAAAGLFSQNTSAPHAAAGLFSQNASAPQNSSVPFAQTASQPAQPSGLFQGQKIAISSLNAPPQPKVTNPFGDAIANPSTSLSAVENSATPNAGAASQTVQDSKVYTPLDQLTKQEEEEFRKDTFTLGKIPTRPPPLELIT